MFLVLITLVKQKAKFSHRGGQVVATSYVTTEAKYFLFKYLKMIIR